MMIRPAALVMAALPLWTVTLWALPPLAVTPAAAQDVPGIELCSREAKLDRRTGCLQSNIEYLQQVITKNALDTQQKLAAAARDSAAMREQLAAAGRDIAALRGELAAAKVRLDQLKPATPANPAK